jgi:hypothetical protein
LLLAESQGWQCLRADIDGHDRKEFGSHLVAYVVINAFLIAVWAFTGAGYFWPVWVLAGWGVGLALHAWETFMRRPVTEADVDRELARQRH